jgi:predicted DNA-binding transcriptional regulator YafY
MSKSDRLFRLLHLIRSLRPPVTAHRLAAAMEVSERTIYRDIEALRVAGARIDGEAGLGYTMQEDPALPPQTFTQMEIEALVLGLSEVQARGDPALVEAARDALTKITATLPERQQRQITHAIGMAVRFHEPADPQLDMRILREASWAEEALDLTYIDRAGETTHRRIYPLAIVYFDFQVVLLAWCCLRQDFRQFLVPSIIDAQPTDESFRPRRVTLLREYTTQLRQRYGERRRRGLT